MTLDSLRACARLRTAQAAAAARNCIAAGSLPSRRRGRLAVTASASFRSAGAEAGCTRQAALVGRTFAVAIASRSYKTAADSAGRSRIAD